MFKFKITDKNRDYLLTYKEACKILKYVKRLYPGYLDGVFVVEGRSFAYCRNMITGERYIEIPEADKSEEILTIGTRILTHINNEFNSNFNLDLKTISLNAFCHEIGHCIDFESHEMVGDTYYEDHADEEYEEFHYKAYDYYAVMEELEDLILHKRDVVDKETVDEWLNEIQDMQEELDYEYRMITTEYAADKFSAEIMNNGLRHLLG